MKISSTHQFSPFGTDSREFKQCQKKLKENRLINSMSAGPLSQILNGVTEKLENYSKVILFNFYLNFIGSI